MKNSTIISSTHLAVVAGALTVAFVFILGASLPVSANSTPVISLSDFESRGIQISHFQHFPATDSVMYPADVAPQ